MKFNFSCRSSLKPIQWINGSRSLECLVRWIGKINKDLNYVIYKYHSLTSPIQSETRVLQRLANSLNSLGYRFDLIPHVGLIRCLSHRAMHFIIWGSCAPPATKCHGKKIMKNNEQYHERNLFANYDDWNIMKYWNIIQWTNKRSNHGFPFNDQNRTAPSTWEAWSQVVHESRMPSPHIRRFVYINGGLTQP